jgi:DNA repair protein RecN (Recombination protein N)
VTAELAGLAMPRAVVSVDVHTRPATGDGPALELAGERVAIGPDGVDEVEVLLRPHPGAPPLPVQRGASGGELSRVMLAIEVVFAGADPVPTMVFDEVDAGVGGRAAVEVGRRLARLAADHQVLVVTHLPQVAAYADAHVVVDKADADGALVTRSDVRLLDDAGRVRELAWTTPSWAGPTPRSCWPPPPPTAPDLPQLRTNDLWVFRSASSA